MVQDVFLTRTAQLADVVLPASSSWCEAEGTVTNSERRVQRVRKALEPPGEARDDMWIISEIAKRLGHDWGTPNAEDVWNEIRTLAPTMFGGMSYARLEERPRAAVAVSRRIASGLAVPARPSVGGAAASGRRAPFIASSSTIRRWRCRTPSIRSMLTTGRRLESYNTGVQTGGYTSPLRRPETLDISPEDAAQLGVEDGDAVRITSRRGSVVAPGRDRPRLRAGLVFMTLHFQDQVRGESADDRRDRSQVRDGRVQGVRRATGARARGAPALEEPRPR